MSKSRKKRILNVGCGNDTYGTHFVDKYPVREDIKKVDVDKERLPYPDNFFDEVYSKNLLEHLANPGFAIQEMFRVLKKGGKLILITDNASYWVWALGKTHHGAYSSKFEEDIHYALYTPEHLVNHLRRVGFKRISFKFVSQRDNFITFLFDKILQFTPLKRFGYKRIEIVGYK